VKNVFSAQRVATSEFWAAISLATFTTAAAALGIDRAAR
jgi:hypothetical protein